MKNQIDSSVAIINNSETAQIKLPNLHQSKLK